MSRVTSIFALILVCVLVPAAQAVPIITNGDFEADDVPNGATQNPPITAWTYVSGITNLPDPDTDRMSSQGGENNTLLTTDGTTWQQPLAITVANNSVYTLTIDVGSDSYQGGTIFPFPAIIGNGVTSGTLRTRLLADNGAAAMPGFLSSNVSTPSVGDFVTWTLVWQTGSSEPLAGTGIVVDLSHLNDDGDNNVYRFVYFDNVSLTVQSVPEPTSVSLLMLGSSAVIFRRRRLQR